MFHLFILLVLTREVFCLDFNYNLLSAAWPLENCSISNECEPNDFMNAYNCDYDICYENGTCHINVAIIAPDDDFHVYNINQTKIFVEKAINDSQKYGLLDNVTVQIYGYNDHCNSENALIAAIRAATVCPHVIVGPSCEYSVAQVGRVGKTLGFGGVPVLSVGGMTYNFVDSKQQPTDEYYLLINGGYADFASFGEFFLLILDAFGWKKLSFLLHRQRQEEFGGENFCKLFMDSVLRKILDATTVDYSTGDLEINKISYEEYIITKLGTTYGIITACTSGENLREFLLTADKMKLFEKREYTIFNFEVYTDYNDSLRPWYDPNDTPENNEIVKNAYKSVFTFRPIIEAHDAGSSLLNSVYESMMMFFEVMNESISLNITSNVDFGCDMYRRISGNTFKGVDDDFQINCNGQRTAKYVLLGLDEDRYEIVATYNTANKTISDWNVKWPNDVIPKDTPECGYDNSKCPPVDSVNVLVISLIVVMCLTILIMALFFYRQYKLKKKIYSYAWKINYADIIFFPRKARSQSFGSIKTTDYDGYSMIDANPTYIPVGYYNTIKVAVKHLAEVKIELDHDNLVELKDMKELSHDNLVKFYGASIDIPNCILTEYCPRGSLQDILENEQIQLDWTFKISLVQDIVRGLLYIHSSPIKSHGSLKSSNCLVDGSFKLKITDFGLHFLRQHSVDPQDDMESHAYWQKQLWTAPELLRMNNRPPKGSQKGDVYSFAIILHEIIMRQGVFYLEERNMSAREIVETVKKGPDANNDQPLRPTVEDPECVDIIQILRRCWAEQSADRPDFSSIKKLLQSNNNNLLDDLLQRMEQYANNLEALVEERTKDYLEEKRKCEELLYQLLPKSVAHKLISGESLIAETYEEVTIYFSDIVGFTTLSAQSTPMEVVDFLNELYTCFDSIIGEFDVYKVETIGDAYMVVSGLPQRNEKKHAGEIARMSMSLLNRVKTFQIPHRPEEKLQLRIGIHTGPCVAGVVGLKMPRYCLFGDTVNTASRMESNGMPLRIHVSAATKEVLDSIGTFDLEYRGEIEIKGKGKMVTYWLNGEREPPPTNNVKSINQHTNRYVLPTKLPSTPVPASVRREMSTNGRSIRICDDVDVPLLSITSEPDYPTNP